MIFKLEFNMDNAAFDILPHEESVLILAQAVKKLKDEGFRDSPQKTPLFDSNGNRVGNYWLEH